MPAPALLGNVPIPAPADPAGFVFPLTVEYGFTTTISPPLDTHLFRAGNLKRTQRYLRGTGARQFTIRRELDQDEHDLLLAFWESVQGATQPFTFICPLADGGTETIVCCFSSEPLITDYASGLTYGVTVNLIEVYTGAGPVYDIDTTLERFPDTLLNEALLEQAQELIKLVTIRPKLSTYPAIYISDRLCTIGGITYQPRLLRWDGIGQVAIGMPGVGTESDEVSLVCGNADRVMRLLTDDVQLDLADIQISFYHVSTRTLVNFWAGIIVPGGWQSNVGPEFKIIASDKLSSPFLIAPPRIIDRRCNRLYNGPGGASAECPFSTVGSLNPAYPLADAASCDHGLTTDNGCYAHSMQLYFNGLVANPQSIRTKDNSTGLFGFFRNSIVAASLINDAAYGHAIPIIVTDISFPVAALIIAGRDEGDFYRAIAVVGEGPLTISNLSTLDGQLNHGYPSNLGFRSISGYDPARPVSGSAGDQDGPFELYPFDTDTPLLYSAGTGGVEILIGDPKGIQLTTLAQHAIEAVVTSGWKGWRWDAPGSRIPATTLLDATSTSMTNPVWFAANLYLLCLKLFGDGVDPTLQEAELDIPQLVYSSAICDFLVDRLVELDEGQEIQWKFIGALTDQKPLRDWLADILLNCLGYYTFKNGKLSIGVRENAGAVVAYTDGNIIWQSLSTAPLGPSFTRLTATFADREHNYVANTATYQDDDYAQELGGGTRPLHRSAQMNLSGTADISPATRFVVTRGREEMGGVDAAERKAGRKVTWKTSALGFDTAPGDVASITNEDMPGGFGKVRVERWKLLDDWSIELTGRTVTESMYNLVIGPKPSDVRPGDIPGEGTGGQTQQPAWRPNRVTAIPGDPLYDLFDRTFQITQQYVVKADGSVQAGIVVEGDLPVNDPFFSVPPKVRTVHQNSIGGNLPGGKSYFLSICAVRGLTPSPASVQIAVQVAANSDTNSITLTDITWPPNPPDGDWDGYVLFASVDHREIITEQLEGGVPLPTSIVLLGNSPI